MEGVELRICLGFGAQKDQKMLTLDEKTKPSPEPIIKSKLLTAQTLPNSLTLKPSKRNIQNHDQTVVWLLLTYTANPIPYP